MELPAYPTIDSLPRRVPLKKALDIPADAVLACEGLSVTALNLPVRPPNCCSKQNIERLDALLSLTINDLFDLPAMGRTSVEEVIKRVCDFFFGPSIRPKSTRLSVVTLDPSLEWKQLTLRDEWNFFSCAANSYLPISLLPLSPETIGILEAQKVCWLEEVLDWTLDDAYDRLGPDHADDLSAGMVATAQGQRHLKITLAEEGAFSDESRHSLLTERWGSQSVKCCGLPSHARSLLVACGIDNLTQLLAALDPLIPPLCFDLAAFSEIWQRLVALELRQGDPFAEWELRLADDRCTANLDAVATAISECCTDRQWDVLNLRYGLLRSADKVSVENAEEIEPDRLTLEQVAQSLDITRERVRQIESTATNRLKEIGIGTWNSVAATLNYLMREAGGVMTLSDSGQELTTRIRADEIDATGLCYLLFEISDAFVAIQRGKIYCLASISPSLYSLVVERAVRICKRSLVNLDEDELVQEVQRSLAAERCEPDLSFIAACLRTDARFSSKLTRRDLNFHLLETLRRLGKPAHFSEIASKLNDLGWRRYKISEKSVNTRLAGERGLFVYLDRGVYGLAEWGLEDRRVFDRQRNGFIGDHIETFLTERDGPAEAAEIVAYVLSKKRCQDYSVLMSLSRDGRFCAFGRGRYGLKKWVM